MNKYELVVIIDAQKAQPEKDEIYKQLNDSLVKGGGKVTAAQVWLERQKFVFNIKKKTEGTYYLINFEAPGPLAKKMDPVLRLNERLLRYLITHVESHTTLAAGKGTTHHS